MDYICSLNVTNAIYTFKMYSGIDNMTIKVGD